MMQHDEIGLRAFSVVMFLRPGVMQNDCFGAGEYTKSAMWDMAVRLAQHSLAMGLDDDDENCLWKYVYFAIGYSKDGFLEMVPDQVRRVLLEQAQFSPRVRMASKWHARMPEKFIKQSFLRKIGVRRTLVYDKWSPSFNSDSVAGISLERAHRDRLEQDFRLFLFDRWYDQLTFWRDSLSGRVVEPSSSDIIVDIDIRELDLVEALKGEPLSRCVVSSKEEADP